MEMIWLGRYMDVKSPFVPKFSEIRNMKPVFFNQDLTLEESQENMEYARSLADKGYDVVNMRRRPPAVNYVNRSSFPRRILFEMTNNCNFRCRMCAQQNMKRPHMDMDWRLYCKVVDEIDSYGTEGLWLYHLGESLLHPHFRDIVKHVSTKKNLGVIWMSTNGQYFTEENIRSVMVSAIDYVNFSAHAVTESVYKKVAPEGDFKIVQGNLEKFYELKGTSLKPYKPFVHCQMIEQEPTKDEVDPFIARHYKRAEVVSVNMLEYVNFPNNKYGAQQRKRRPLTSCLRVDRNDAYIFSNGDVTICPVASNAELWLGNVNKQTLHEIWNGKERKSILDHSAKGTMSEIEFCKPCTDYDI
jgi:radical SAM protein with 4Fe4S-binding SPASM domain